VLQFVSPPSLLHLRQLVANVVVIVVVIVVAIVMAIVVVVFRPSFAEGGRNRLVGAEAESRERGRYVRTRQRKSGGVCT
jgi:hypothetical protein